jgi:hypothetical protein
MAAAVVGVEVAVALVAAADAVSSRAVKIFPARLRRFHGGAGQVPAGGLLPGYSARSAARFICFATR